MRAGEARRLQAGLLPNPEVEIDIEEFGGSSTRTGFDAATTKLQLSQLTELGGKRGFRTRVADIEKDLAEWDYRAGRLNVLTDATKAFIDVLAAQEQLALAGDLHS